MGIGSLKWHITLAERVRKRRGRRDWSVYLDCGRVLHELSTEALSDGAVDLLLRLSAIKNDFVLRTRTGKETE